MCFAYSVLLTPLLCVEVGRGHRATHLRHRTRFPSSRLGFRCFLTSSVIFHFLKTIGRPSIRTLTFSEGTIRQSPPQEHGAHFCSNAMDAAPLRAYDPKHLVELKNVGSQCQEATHNRNVRERQLRCEPRLWLKQRRRRGNGTPDEAGSDSA